MNETEPDDRGSLAAVRDARIDEACDRFERAWKSGDVPCIAELLPADDADLELRSELLKELILVDQAYRWRADAGIARSPATGETVAAGAAPPLLEDYARQFPELGGVERLPLCMIVQEYDLRREAGESLDPREYAGRFPNRADLHRALSQRAGDLAATVRPPDRPLFTRHGDATPRSLGIRCPHCHNQVDVVADRLLTEVVCRSCGSSFSLVGTGHQTQHSATLTSVGHFELIEQLGVGGFGTVWKARDTKLGRTVAVKIPRKGELDASEAELFLREARTAAQLRHPNIVSVFEAGRDGDTLYLVSEFVRGVTLRDRLTAGPLNEHEAAQMCEAIAEALDHAHRAGVVHRDLKPSNIMLDRQGAPHLMDFGLAKRDANEITMTLEGRILGTPAYMSPEQARGEGHRADGRSDIYSLGVVLFELLTRELPFRGNDRMILLQVLEDPPPSPRKLNRLISRDLETITLKCLEKEPRRRYQSARELRDELRRFIERRPILARPIRRSERVWRWCKRQPALAALAASCLISLLAGAATSGYFAAKAYERAEQQRQDHARAEREARILTAQRLASQSNEVRQRRPRLSLLLAHEAVDSTRRRGESVVPAADQALRDSLAFVGGRVLAGHHGPLESVAISPDSRWIVTTSEDGIGKIWSADEPASAPWELALGPARSERDGLEQVDELRAISPGITSLRKFPMTFSADGRWLCLGAARGRAILCDLRAGDLARDTVAMDLSKAAVTAVDFSPTGSHLAIADAAGAVGLWLLNDAGPMRHWALPSAAGAILSIDFSSDGKWLAVGDSAGATRLWNVDQPDAPLVLAGEPGAAVAAVAFSSDGRWLGSAFNYVDAHDNSNERVVARLWDMSAPESVDRSHALRDRFQAFGGFWCSPHGQWAATHTSAEGIAIWELGTDGPATSPRRLSAGQGVKCLAANADGSVLAAGSTDGRIDIMRIGDGLVNSHSLVLHEDDRGVVAVEFASDGRWLASASADGTARLWPLEELLSQAAIGREFSIPLRGHEGRITSLAVSGNGRVLVTGGEDGTARAWSLAPSSSSSDAIPLPGRGHGRAILHVSPDSRWLVTSSEDDGLSLWDLRSEEPFQSPQPIRLGDAPIVSVSMSASPNWLVAVNDRGATYLANASNPDASSERLPVTGPVARQNGAVISRDGQWLATRRNEAGDVELWRMDHDGIRRDARVQTWAFYMTVAGDSRWLVTVNEQEVLRWNITDTDAPDGPVSLMNLPSRASPMVAISPDRHWISHGAFGPEAGKYRGDVRLCDLSEHVPATRTLLVRVEQRPLDLALGVEGQWLAATSGVGAVNLWKCDATDALGLPYKLRGDNRRITAMAFSPDRQWFVTADEGGVVRLWDLTSADPSQAAVALRGHSSDVTSIVISPDGRWLFAAATDGAYRAWRLQRDELLRLARQAAGRDLTAEEYDQYVAPTNRTSP